MAKIPSVKITNRYQYNDAASPSVEFNESDPKSRNLTNQSDADSVNINKIMERYDKTGLIPDGLLGTGRTPQYGDFTTIGDFHSMQDQIAKATQAFQALPATIRTMFDNDPGNLINYLADSKNDEQAVKLGLKDKDVLLTAFADDGVTRISPTDRAYLDAEKLKKEASGKPGASPAPAGAPLGA